MADLSATDRDRGLHAQLKEARARPITEPALVESMMSDAGGWMNAVHVQHRRITRPITDDPGEEPFDGRNALGATIWRQEIDLHFLLVALTRLRRAVRLAASVGQLQQALSDRITEFDERVPYLSRLRNVGEHFDDYTAGRGRDSQVSRTQLQTWTMSFESYPESRLTWYWAGEEMRPAEAHAAAMDLYQGFLAEAERYLAALPRKVHFR
jgi:hypothetical protein